MPLPAWVNDKAPGRAPEARSIGLERYRTSASTLARWVVSGLLALTYSYRLLFMKGSLAAKCRWLRKAVDPGWIARRFSG